MEEASSITPSASTTVKLNVDGSSVDNLGCSSFKV
jgi:hypothetical protein